jgi:hypothetical protein
MCLPKQIPKYQNLSAQYFAQITKCKPHLVLSDQRPRVFIPLIGQTSPTPDDNPSFVPHHHPDRLPTLLHLNAAAILKC